MSQTVKVVHRAGREGLQIILKSSKVGCFILEFIEFIIAILGDFTEYRVPQHIQNRTYSQKSYLIYAMNES